MVLIRIVYFLWLYRGYESNKPVDLEKLSEYINDDVLISHWITIISNIYFLFYIFMHKLHPKNVPVWIYFVNGCFIRPTEKTTEWHTL